MINSESLTKEKIVELLNLDDEEFKIIHRFANRIKKQNFNSNIYLRGLIELSNICKKNCSYCGIRRDNNMVNRYTMDLKDVVHAIDFANNNNFGSIVIQSGEQTDKKFSTYISTIINLAKKRSNGNLCITLSCGEQKKSTLQEWYNCGAERYLLRIETSNPLLYAKIHPNDNLHSFDNRIQCLKDLSDIGYQVGSGVMIGLPFQKIENLAEDLLFLNEIDIDMCGMGPYIENPPSITALKNTDYSIDKRLKLSLRMISLLRILMKDINIAATTALQSIDFLAREKALNVGANVIMPNLSPIANRTSYKLYTKKHSMQENIECLKSKLGIFNHNIAFREKGDSLHYLNKIYLR